MVSLSRSVNRLASDVRVRCDVFILGFFDDILIPSTKLQHPSRFIETEQTWAWQYEAEDGPHDLVMDINEEIR